MPATTPTQGDLIHRYRLEQLLGEGGFGAVWSAEATDTHERVAIKLLHPEHCDRSDQVLRFLREATASEAVSHPNVVRIHEVGQTPDLVPYIVMELLEGIDLEHHLALRGRLELGEVLSILEPIVAVLDLAHSRGIIHRDIKASNVFLDRGRVVVLDFGIAKLRAVDGIDLTHSRMRLGSLGSAAPEQLTGKPVGPGTDVYALGVLTYQLLTGQLPFVHEQLEVINYLHVHATRPRASAIARVPPGTDAAIEAAMSVDPAGRPVSARAFLELLRASTVTQPSSKSSSERGPAVGVQLQLHPTSADDLEAVDRSWVRIRERFDSVGLAPQIEAPRFAMFTSRLGGDDHRHAVLAAIFAAVYAVNESGMLAHATIHVDDAIVSGHRIVGGPLFDIDAWTPATRAGDVMATGAAETALSITGLPAPGAPGFVVVRESPSNASPDQLKRWMHTQMLARIGRDAATISHDMRGPLTVTMIGLEMLDEERASIPERLHQWIDDGLESTRHVVELVDTLVQLASRKSFATKTQPVSIQSAVRKAVKLARTRILAKGTLEIVVPDGDTYVDGSEGALVLALMNLLHNASDAIPVRGQVSVVCAIEADHVRVSVLDSGEGMAESVKDQIFEPFFTTKRPGEGSGLGLSMVHEVVKHAGGTIRVESTLGVGTSFVIELPRTTERIP